MKRMEERKIRQNNNNNNKKEHKVVLIVCLIDTERMKMNIKKTQRQDKKKHTK